MKLLIPLILFTALSNNAHAMHTYREESCKSLKHNFAYTGNYMFGGLYEISLKSHDEKISALPETEESDTHNTLDDADVLFETIKYKKLTRTKMSKDCWFSYESWKSMQTIQIKSIKPEAAKALGLKQGDKIVLICEESIDYPNRPESDRCKDE